MDYQCEVQAVGASAEGAWTPAGTTVTPIGLPAAPGKPAVAALDRALRVSVPPDPGVTGFHYECSPDKGATWPAGVDVDSATATTVQIGSLTNGVEYLCRAFAVNALGQSDASPVSDAVKPCSSLLDCNGLVAPVLGLFGVVLAAGLLAAAIALYRERGRRGYVVAVVDVVYTANIGHGSRLGIAFERAPGSKVVTGIVAEPWKTADIKVRYLGRERFHVIDTAGRHPATSGEPITVVAGGVRHELVLRAFATAAASTVTTRR